RQTTSVGGLGSEDMVRQAERRLSTNPGESGELVCESLDQRHRSIDSLETRNVEGEGKSARELAHLLLVKSGRTGLRLIDCRENEIFEHLYIRRIDDRFVDVDLSNLAPSIGRDRNHAAPARARHGPLTQLCLKLCDSGL